MCPTAHGVSSLLLLQYPRECIICPQNTTSLQGNENHGAILIHFGYLPMHLSTVDISHTMRQIPNQKSNQGPCQRWQAVCRALRHGSGLMHLMPPLDEVWTLVGVLSQWRGPLVGFVVTPHPFVH